MIRNTAFFPWRLFRRFVSIQSAVLAGSLLVGLVFIRVYLRSFASDVSPGILQEIDRVLFVSGGLAILGIFVASFWLSWNALMPLARLRRKLAYPEEGFGDEELHVEEEEPEEWADVTVGIDKLTAKFRKRSDLSRRVLREIDTVLGAVSDAVVIVKPNGEPMLLNAQFEKLFFGETTSRRTRLKEFVRVPEVLNAFDEVFRMKVGQNVEVGFYPRKENLPRYFTLSVAPLARPGSSDLYGVIGVFHEITDLKRADQMRIDFVANVSHELRTPLTSLKGYADTVKGDMIQGRTDKNSLKFMDIISQNTDRLMNLVNDLLDLSSLESGSSIQRHTISTQQATEDAIARVREMAGSSHRVNARFDVDVVEADPGRIDQVLVNLIHNAIKYTPPGTAIDVVWEKETDTGVVLRVKDGGPGISPEHLPRLFERFYRVDTARSREMGGTGLGLSIVKHIMKRHGGHAEVRSILGKGSEFICHFPR